MLNCRAPPLPTNRSCTAWPLPSSLRPLSWVSITRCRGRAGRAAWLGGGADGWRDGVADAAAATDPAGAAVGDSGTAGTAGGTVLPSAGRPLSLSNTGPSSTRAAAWRCRRAGCSACTCRSSARLSPAHSPWPLSWPAPALASARVRLKRSSVRRSGWRGLALAFSTSRCTGSRPVSQAPGSRLSSVASTVAGWSSPLDCTLALPVRAVWGRPGSTADRSSLSVLRFRSPSGQLAKGSSVARTSSAATLAATGACVGPAWPRRRATAASRSSGPCRSIVALQPSAATAADGIDTSGAGA